MKSGVPWQLKGVGRDARETAQEAARRAGMSVAEWLDSVIINSAMEAGVAAPPMQADHDQADDDDLAEEPPYDDRWYERRDDVLPAARFSEPPEVEDGDRRAAARQESPESRQRAHRDETNELREADRAADLPPPRRRKYVDYDERQRRVPEAELAKVHDHLASLGRQLQELASAGAQPPRRPQVAAPAPLAPPAPAPASAAPAQREPDPPRRLVDVISQLDNRLDKLISNGQSETSEIERRLRDVDRAIAGLNGSAPATAAPPRPRPDDPATPLDQALIEIAERQRALDGEAMPRADLPRAPTQDFSSLEQQLRQINSRIETLRPCRIEGAVETLRDDLAEIGLMVKEAMPRRAVEALESEVRSLAERIDTKRNAGVDDTALAGLENGLAEVRDALRTLTPAENLVGLDDALRTIAHKIDGVAAGQQDPAALEQLEGAITGLRGVVAHVASNEALDTLSQEMRSLAAKVDQIANFDVLGPLEQRIGAIADALQSRHQQAGSDARELENVVQSLGDKLERLQLTRADHAAVVHLEDRITRLVEKLDASDARLGHLESIERGLAELLVHIENLQRAPSAAPAAAAMPQVDALQRDVQRTQDLLEAVHGTLGTLVDRLASIESGLREESAVRPAIAERSAELAAAFSHATAAVPPPPATPAPPAPRAAAAAKAPSFTASGNPAPATEHERRPIDPDLPPDTPLEPGAMRGRGAATPAERIAASEAALGAAKPPVIPDPAGKSNFINAARRAAQIASTETATRADRKAAPAAPGTGKKRLSERVRQVLVGTSVVLIVLGSLHIAANLLFSSSEPPGQSEEEATPPAPTGATPSTPAARPAAPAPTIPPAPAAPAPAAAPPGRQSILLPGETGIPFATPPSGIVMPSAPAAAKPAREADIVTGSVLQSAAPAAPAPAEAAPAARTAARTPATEKPATTAEKLTGADKLPASIGSVVLRAAAVHGDADAEYEIAQRYADGHGVPRNLPEAAVWFERAAKRGLVPAQFRLGGLYEKGLGVPKNIEAARKLYIGAAEAGNPKAMHNLAVLYAEGVDGKPDYPTAARWFRKAADYGVADSQYNLGILYARGIGVETNLAEAYRWFSLASREGDKDAAKKRDDVGGRLDQQSLMAARAAVQVWAAGVAPEAAVEVKVPPGGWDAVAVPGVAKRHIGPKTDQ